MNSRFFIEAKPCFAEGLRHEMNVTCGFYTSVVKKNARYVMHITASSFYRLFVNGKFVCTGPERCGHGYYRVDMSEITEYMDSADGVNHIAIEVTGYNMNSFEYLDMPSFLCAELYEDGKAIASTGEGGGFTCYVLTERAKKAQRMSFQRPMTECYSLYPGYDAWRIGDAGERSIAGIKNSCEEKFVSRGVGMNSYTEISPDKLLTLGRVRHRIPESYWNDRSIDAVSPVLKGYRRDELEVKLSDELCEFEITEKKSVDEHYCGSIGLCGGKYAVLSLDNERTGFVSLKMKADEDSLLYIAADEILKDGDVDPLRLGAVAAIRLEVKKGDYTFISAEPYGFRYMKLICAKGRAEVDKISLLEYRYPEKITSFYGGEDSVIAKIYSAALESFCQNASDIFMDCPTRERAGWLCDSFFTARAEYAFTGKNTMEKDFLENFVLTEGFKNIPAGMLPMCYPSDHYDGVFIPNWAMWFVVELDDCVNVRRSADRSFAAKFEGLIRGLLDYFRRFENEYGLLEHLESWVFVEWSRANDLVQDVNYPTNMLYSAMLRCAGRLLGDASLFEKAERIACEVRRRSYDGSFFRDNDIRRGGELVSSGEITETCQYYAFFFDIASPETYPELWRKLTDEFGPGRGARGLYPNIHPSNAFIGNYLRLDTLTRYGFREKCLAEIRDYFAYMADKTGTLWENVGDYASCNHGFASYAAYLINKNT